ncbi:MAG TPA: dihydroorotate dehydrogenase electron transfer subunit, partial [bacterium]|nr:dihydroorotate dehydrogenase electron transfer subunit [bacterium]
DMKHQKVILLSKKIYSDRYVDMWFKNNLSDVPEPGQFIHISTGASFIRRPFSIAEFTKEQFRILFQIKGCGTRNLADKKIGSGIDIIGPVGNCFPIKKRFNMIYIAAGGVGIAPLLFLASSLIQNNKKFMFFYGAKTRLDLLDFLMPGGDYEKVLCTDDGSSGEKGTVVDVIKKYLKQKKPDVIFSAGPYLMLKGISQLCDRYNVEAYVSLENVMFCGLGVCQGCVINTKTGYKRVCKDGPVFNHRDILWQRKALI